MTLDCYATTIAYLDHERPVWEALPPEVRGTFWTGTRALTKHAEAHGMATTLGNPRMPGPAVLVAGYSDYTQVHPERPIVYLEHGAGQSYSQLGWHPSYPGGKQRKRVGLFLVPGPRSAALERAEYPEARVEIIGSPRLDSVVRFPAVRHPDAPLVVAFAWHWDLSLVPETRWAWPVWRDVVRELAQSGEFQVIGTGHPRQYAQLAKWYATVGIEAVPDSLEVLARADVVCFDNTSLGFEAMACGLGVVGLNAPWYRKDVEHGLRFWEYAPPVSIWPGGDLAEAVHAAAAPEARAVTLEMSKAVYPPNTRGCATALAVDAIMDFLENGAVDA